MTLPVVSADSTGVEIRIFVQPGAARTSLCGLYGDAIKIRVAAPPEKGAANRAVESFLADTVGVRKNAVNITAGTTSRHKTVRIDNISETDVLRMLGVE